MTRSVRAKLNEKFVAGIVAGNDPKREQTLYLDEELKGFVVGVSTKKVLRRSASRTCRMTIAATNAISFKDARERAKKLIVEMRAGIDPKAKTRDRDARRNPRVLPEEEQVQRASRAIARQSRG